MTAAAAAAAGTPFHDLARYVAIPRVTALRLSPDGSWLAAAVQTLAPDRRTYVTSIWRGRWAGSDRLAVTRGCVAASEARARLCQAGGMARADLDKRPGDVAAMFDELAGRYDLLNDLLSAGQVRWWRRVVAGAVGARAGERILDLAAGTGTSTVTFGASGADCVACDFSLGMLRAGLRRVRAAPDSPQPMFVAGDAIRLPFSDSTFDAVTISFGLRNVVDPARALAEMFRVTRPGGRLVICDFSRLSARPLRVAYERYLARALPAIARRAARNPAAYEYLAESIVDWPDQQELARMLHAAGWSAVKWRNLTFGIVAVHVARCPG